MNKLTRLFGLFAILVSGPTLAGQNMSSDLAAPHVHLAPANIYTTHYIITNQTGAANNITTPL